MNYYVASKKDFGSWTIDLGPINEEEAIVHRLKGEWVLDERTAREEFGLDLDHIYVKFVCDT